MVSSNSQLLNNTETAGLTTALFGNGEEELQKMKQGLLQQLFLLAETLYPIVYSIYVADLNGVYEPDFTDSTKLTLPLASAAGAEAYEALAYATTVLIEDEESSDEYYLPRHILALELPASAPGSNTTWSLMAEWFSDIFAVRRGWGREFGG